MKRILVIVLGDFASFWLSLYIILYIRFGSILSSDISLKHIIPFTILYISWILIFYLFGLYDLFNIKPTIPHLRRFGLALVVSFIVGIFFFYFVPVFGISPKTNLIFQVVGFGGMSFIIRRIFYLIYSKQITKQTILIGEKKHLDELSEIIKINPQIGLQVICHLKNLSEAIKNYPEVKNTMFIIDTISDKIETKNIEYLYKNNNEIIDIAKAYEKYVNKIPVDYISQSWIIENINVQKDILYELTIRLFNIFLSLITLLIFSPILLISSIFIYFYDKGPIFYIQKRIGLNGKIFKLYKLRSMIVNSELNGAVWSGENDPRITPMGRVIRKLHIDEIPQMINILKGDLSFIGPRPERPEFVSELEELIPHYKLRHVIRPGFTGWAQIKYHYARTINDSKEKFEYDLYYIKNRNIFIDFGIFLKTIQIIFTH